MLPLFPSRAWKTVSLQENFWNWFLLQADFQASGQNRHILHVRNVCVLDFFKKKMLFLYCTEEVMKLDGCVNLAHVVTEEFLFLILIEWEILLPVKRLFKTKLWVVQNVSLWEVWPRTVSPVLYTAKSTSG